MKMAISSSIKRLKQPYQNIHFGKVVLTLILALAMIFSNFNVVQASNVKTMTVTFEESTNRNRSKTVTIPNLKSIVNVKANTGSVTHSINGDNVTLNVSGGAARRVQTGGSYIPASSKTENATRTGTAKHMLDTGVETGFPPSSVSFNSGGYGGTLSQTRFEWIGSLNFSSDGDFWTRTWKAYYSGTVTKPAVDTRTYADYYSYTVTIEYIDNSSPTLSLSLPIENSYFGKEIGYNSISIDGNVKDIDVGDNLIVKYTINGISGHTNKTIYTATANGSNQKFSHNIMIDDTIPEGNYQINIWVEDNKGGKSTTINIPLFIDKTGPISKLKEENVKAIDTNSIEIKATATDNMVGLKETDTYLYNRDGEDVITWTKNDAIIDTELKPNKRYSYKFKSIDKLNNIGEYSNIVDRYTLALNPIEVRLTEHDTDSLTFSIINNQENDKVPQTKLIAKKKGTNEIVSISDWNQNPIKTLKNLEAGQEYEIYINTRNEDLIANYEEKNELKISSNSKPPLLNEKGEPVDNIVTKPLPPKGLVINVNGPNEVEFKWNSVPTAIKYHPEYKTTNSNTWIEIGEIEDTFITIKDLNPNEKYDFRVRAENSIGLSDYSTISRYTFANKPINILYSDIKQTELTINWEGNGNPNHTKYEIGRKLSGENDLTFTKIGEVTELKFKDTSLAKGELYAYRVRAINGDGIPTEYSSGNEVITVPENPTITVVANKNEEPMKTTTITWDSIKGAVKYAVYVEEDGQRKLLNDGVTELAYIHNNLTPNKKYTYFVQALNENGASGDSKGVSVFTQALSIKGTNGLKVKSTTETTVVFNVVNDSRNNNLPETKIEIKDKNGNIVAISDFSTSIENRELTGLTSGVEYEVWVTTRNSDAQIINDSELIFNSFYSNRKPELQSITLSEGGHHEGKSLKVSVQSKEFDIGDKIKVMYSITGMLSAQNKQIIRPLNAEPFNYIHNSTIVEYEGFIDFTGEEENGIYEITFWIEDSGGLKSDTIVKTFKISKADYYLDELDKIAEGKNDEELKEAIEVILGDEFKELYFPNPLPEHMTEKEYLDIIREEIKQMTKPITKEDVRKMIALVNINCRLSFGRQETIPKKEIIIVLDKESNRYKDNLLPSYQKELKRMYGSNGNPIMRLDEIDVLNAIKLVNFNKKPVDTITIEDIVDLIGNSPKTNENNINEYKESIKELREKKENPTLEDIKNIIEIVNINKKIEDGNLTIEDLKKLLPEVTIYPEYSNEYLKYLRMYKEDLGRNLNVEDIKKVVESVNGVKKYENNTNSENRDKALEKINLLADGSVKKELTERITPLEKPEIDTSKYQDNNKNNINSFLNNPSSTMLFDLNGQKTIVSNSSIIDLNVINIKGASYIRYITQENSKEEYSEWKSINGDDYSRKLVYKDQGTYLAGVQVKNNFNAQSEIEDINVVIDWTAPKGQIIKKSPSQTVVKGSSISIKVVAEDNLKMPMYIKVNGTWKELTNEFFEYHLDSGEGEKLIEVELSDIAGNKTILHEKIWKID